MDWQSIIQVIAAPMVGALCWMIYQLNAKLEAVKDEQFEYKVYVAESYLKKADAKDAFEKFDKVLERVEDKIDRLSMSLIAVRKDIRDGNHSDNG